MKRLTKDEARRIASNIAKFARAAGGGQEVMRPVGPIVLWRPIRSKTHSSARAHFALISKSPSRILDRSDLLPHLRTRVPDRDTP
jgi:hypothetical protein